MSSRRIRVAVAGAPGRMGLRVLQEACDAPDLEVVGALSSPTHVWAGRDLGVCMGRLPMGVTVSGDPETAFQDVEVVIDFSLPHATLGFLPNLRAHRIPLVCGTTGFTSDQRKLFKEAAREIPLVLASNMSPGATVLLDLVRQAAARLGPEFDIEVMELHHRLKRDAPSGTALSLIDAALLPSGRSAADACVTRPVGHQGLRTQEEVGVATLRGGDVAGDHTVFFLGMGERLELTHRAGDRRAFALGALRAARWLVGRPPAVYSMQDVLAPIPPGQAP